MTLPAGTTDSEWIHHMVEEHGDRLVVYAGHLLRDPHRAQDVAQDVFVRLCAQPRAAVEDHLKQWLYTVCRHRCLDLLRKENRMIPMSEEQELVSGEAGPHETLARQESAGQVTEQLERLPHNQREVIRLKFLHGLSYREISTITRLSEGNVGFLIHTGLRQLRQQLQGLGTMEGSIL